MLEDAHQALLNDTHDHEAMKEEAKLFIWSDFDRVCWCWLFIWSPWSQVTNMIRFHAWWNRCLL
jgi:hypothetical protein